MNLISGCTNNSSSSDAAKITDEVDNQPPAQTESIIKPPLFDDGSDSWFIDRSPTLVWSEAIASSPRTVERYEIAIGSTVGGTDIKLWTNVGLVGSYKMTGLSLQRGRSYYASVRAIDDKGNYSQIKEGDGWTVNTELITTNGVVNAMVKSGKILYIGGHFTMIGGEYRSNLAAIDVSGVGSNAVLPFNPSPDDIVNAMVLSNSKLYIGGNFKNVGGISRKGIASIDIEDISGPGVVTTLNPQITRASPPDPSVNSLVLDSNRLYIGGGFNYVYGVPKSYIAAIDVQANSGVGELINQFNFTLSETVYSMQLDGAKLHIGGGFTYVNGVAKNHLAIIDVSTNSGYGSLTQFNVGTDYFIRSLAVSNGIIYIAGAFNTVGGSSRNGIAAINATSNSGLGSLTTLSVFPASSTSVQGFSVFIDSNILYFSGLFNTVLGLTRNWVSSIEITSGANSGTLTTFNPDADSPVYSFVKSDDVIYLGGGYTAMSDNGNPYLNVVEIGTGRPIR